ncbi:MAG: sigma-70 family RNA polymerase sigma factor [Fimbriimonadales bacterium]
MRWTGPADAGCESRDRSEVDAALRDFGSLVDAFQSRLYGFVRRILRDDEEALDLTQEVFVRAFRNLRRFDGRCSLKAWLFKIAHNLCVDRMRRRRVRFAEEPLESGEDEPHASLATDNRWNPESLILTDELLGVVERAIEGLSPRLRSVLILCDREELPYEEIAQVLEVPLGTVKSRLFAAREQVARAVRQYLEGEA